MARILTSENRNTALLEEVANRSEPYQAVSMLSTSTHCGIGSSPCSSRVARCFTQGVRSHSWSNRWPPSPTVNKCHRLMSEAPRHSRLEAERSRTIQAQGFRRKKSKKPPHHIQPSVEDRPLEACQPEQAGLLAGMRMPAIWGWVGGWGGAGWRFMLYLWHRCGFGLRPKPDSTTAA